MNIYKRQNAIGYLSQKHHENPVRVILQNQTAFFHNLPMYTWKLPEFVFLVLKKVNIYS